MSLSLSRRSLVRSTAFAPLAVNSSGFRHRLYCGWITDLATRPDPTAAWPSMRLDETLLADYDHTFDIMLRLGFHGAVIWGLYVTRAWPLDLASAVEPARGAMVRRLIDAAHQRNLLVYSGLGVFSWGFERILKANPRLSKGNTQAMCGSEPEAWKWMHRVVDYVFERFPIDGVSLQSADQGRCPCDRCRAYTDTGYHAMLNARVSEYIRARWPGKRIGAASWGMKLGDERTLDEVARMTARLDYFVDHDDSSRRADPGYRRRLIARVPCAFGTLGGPQVEPPQHWERRRWFLPTPRRVAEHISALAADGGSAVEFFFHILANPGDEITMWTAGKALAEPGIPWHRHLEESVRELYGAAGPSTRALAAFFERAEDAYMRHLPPGLCGTISLEPLVSDRPGPPVYLKRLDAAARAAYASALARLDEEARGLAAGLPAHGRQRVERIRAAIAGTRQDVAASSAM